MRPSDTDNHLHQFGLFCHCVFKLGGNYLLYIIQLTIHSGHRNKLYLSLLLLFISTFSHSSFQIFLSLYHQFSWSRLLSQWADSSLKQPVKFWDLYCLVLVQAIVTKKKHDSNQRQSSASPGILDTLLPSLAKQSKTVLIWHISEFLKFTSHKQTSMCLSIIY